MNSGQSFVADSEAAKPMQPCDGLLHDPADLSQAAAVFGSASRNLRLDTSRFTRCSTRVRIVAAIDLDKVGFALRTPGLPASGGIACTRGSNWMTSLRLAWARMTESGMPCASLRMWCFEPGRRRSVGFGPVFFQLPGADRRTVGYRSGKVDSLCPAKLRQQYLVQPIPHLGSLPRLQPSPTGAPGTAAHFLGQHLPWDPGTQHKHDPGRCRSIGNSLRAPWIPLVPALGPRHEWFDNIPQFVVDQGLGHRASQGKKMPKLTETRPS